MPVRLAILSVTLVNGSLIVVKIRSFIVFWCLLMPGGLLAEQNQVSKVGPLRFVAENLPPFHFLGTDNKPTGALVEVVQALTAQTGVAATIELMPFARVYQLTSHQPDVFMFSLLRSPSREKQFVWVGQTYKIEAYLVGLKIRDDLSLNSLDDAKNYVVGTIRGYHSDHFLRDAGFVVDDNLSLSTKYQRMWRMLFKGRIDLVFTNSIAHDRELTSIKLDPKDIKQYLVVSDFPNQLHIATNSATSKQTVKVLQNGLEQLKHTGRYQQIIDKWGL
jgi:polar amino acid transport system substrate-binding protein